MTNLSHEDYVLASQRESEVLWHLVSALAGMCIANPAVVVEMLTGYLWTKEEANNIKRVGMGMPIRLKDVPAEKEEPEKDDDADTEITFS